MRGDHMENKPPPLQIIIINVGQRYVQESDREIKKHIGRILEGLEKRPCNVPQRRKGRGK